MQDVDTIVEEALEIFAAIGDPDALEGAKAKYLGRSGALTELLKGLGKLPAEARREQGARINAAARAEGMTYNRFISGLRLAGIQVDRKVLADIAVTDPRTFASLVTSARQGLSDANGSSGSSGKA